jgi:hypothetical protein
VGFRCGLNVELRVLVIKQNKNIQPLLRDASWNRNQTIISLYDQQFATLLSDEHEELIARLLRL